MYAATFVFFLGFGRWCFGPAIVGVWEADGGRRGVMGRGGAGVLGLAESAGALVMMVMIQVMVGSGWQCERRAEWGGGLRLWRLMGGLVWPIVEG